MSTTHDLARLIDELAPRYTALSDAIWDDPELRWEETASAERHIELARAEGFRITPAIGGVPTAFSAEAGSGEPVIAVLGEYDALAGLSQESGNPERTPDPANTSGNGQGCGHHLLGAGSLLAATAVKRYLEENGLPGTVRYYGCPAEEAAAGKTFMVAAGAFDDVDASICWHPGDSTLVQRDHSLAYMQSYVRFTGLASHAGASPELGRSALDALELMNVGVNFLREHMLSDCRIHYAILDGGGRSANVVQPYAEAYYVVRAPNVREMRALFERVRKIAEGAALMTETTVEIEVDGGSSNLLGNTVLETSMQDTLLELGPVPFDERDLTTARQFLTDKPLDMFGTRIEEGDSPLHDGVITFDAGAPRRVLTGSTDVGDVSWVTPTVQCTTACVSRGTPAHSWQLVAQGKLPAAHKGMVHAAKIMAGSAMNLLTDASLLKLAKEEFLERTTKQPYDSPLVDGVIAPPLR